MEQLPDLVLWSAAVGALLPPVVAIVNQPRWPSWLKGTVAVTASVAAGAVTATLSGQLTGKSWLSSALIVVTLAIGSYEKFWKPSTIAPRIENATSPPGRHRAADDSIDLALDNPGVRHRPRP
ncbi:MAG: hypothetical protein M3N43_13455 [Actinomycetota bacterium]|nr:hypothetical protein [Actinomycetota bacterium]